jgi:FkbM family methyltransferase
MWFKDRGDETLRLNYPLNKNSVVFDLGGYKGNFAADIYGRFGCNIYIFEPIKKYYLECHTKFNENRKIKCFNYGLSNVNGHFNISNGDNASSLILSNSIIETEKVLIKRFSEEMEELGVSEIDLLKMDIEGAEFFVLEDIFSNGTISKIKFLQIQFHTFFPNSDILRDQIRSKLCETHTEQWCYPFIWESWQRKAK